MLNRPKCPPHFTLEQRLLHVGWTERLVVPELGPCHEWKGAHSKGNFNYGQLHMPGQDTKLVHRLAYRTWVDPDLPADVILRHKCDNPPCMNTLHLHTGTRADNSRDAVDRERIVKGSDHQMAKLTEEQVREIRRRAKTERQMDLAVEYGVNQPSISMIVNRKTWRHV